MLDEYEYEFDVRSASRRIEFSNFRSSVERFVGGTFVVSDVFDTILEHWKPRESARKLRFHRQHPSARWSSDASEAIWLRMMSTGNWITRRSSNLGDRFSNLLSIVSVYICAFSNGACCRRMRERKDGFPFVIELQLTEHRSNIPSRRIFTLELFALRKERGSLNRFSRCAFLTAVSLSGLKLRA